MHTSLSSSPSRKRKASDISVTPPYDDSVCSPGDDEDDEDDTERTRVANAAAISKPIKATTDSTSRLLSLPAELRLEIYQHVLLQPCQKSIIFSPTNPPEVEPGLLQTNTQIRREASPIYYNLNRFKIYINDFDSRTYRKWYNSSLWRRRCKKEYVIRESTNWLNLLDWLRAYYVGESSMPGQRRSGKPCISASMFSLVRRMKRKQVAGLAGDWEEVEACLRDVHAALVATDARWKV